MSVPDYVKKRVTKWNAATAFAMQSCDVPFTVYFETFRPAAGKAVIHLLSFGIDDVARGMFRPKGIYPQRHLGRKKRRASSVYLPEFGEEIGKRLPGAEGIKARRFGAYEKSLWLLDGVFQRLMFWLMVADITTDFVFDWSSSIMAQGYCKNTGSSTYLNEGITFDAADLPSRHWQFSGGGVTKYDNNTFGLFPHERSCALRPGTSALAEWTFTTGTGSDLETDVTLSQEPPVIIDLQHVSLGENETKTVTLQVTSNGGRVLTWPINLGGSGPCRATCKVFSII